MSDWKEYKLGEVATFQRGHDLPKTEMLDGDIPVAGSNGIIGYHDKHTTVAPGLTIGRSGNIGTPHFYKKPFWAHNTVLFIKDFHGNVEKFIYYFLKTIDFTQFNTGSAVPSLNRNHIHELDILLPSLKEQQRIAEVLSSLDDKIDLLGRQNVTLEAMAETIFRQYFIENPNPNWKEKSLLDCIELVGGGTPKTSIETYWNGDVCWLTGGDISNNHKGYTIQSEKKISNEGLTNSSAQLLPTNATIISARGTVGKYCLLSRPMAFSQSNYGILPQFKDCYYFTFLLIAYSVNELQSAAYGSVFDTITTNTFKSLTISLPDEKNISSFELLIAPYFEKMYNNTLQIRALTKLRDTLLPKLINGEITVNG